MSHKEWKQINAVEVEINRKKHHAYAGMRMKIFTAMMTTNFQQQ